MDLTEFWTIASGNGIVLDKEQLERIERFAKELVYWNKQVNLISRKDEENVLENHILHSISLLKYLEIPPKSRCLDIGTGGGLPGIPIAIATGNISMLLIDSIAKKIKITNMLAKHTGLRNIEAICMRVENLAQNDKYLEHFDFVFARAVTKISDLLTWSIPIAKKNANFVFYKGGDISEELSVAKKKFPSLSFSVIDIDFFGYPKFKEDEKKIVHIKKME
ncbi:MAG TPA: 16S rRNA (guanine(527)-N(7))-methyltransferase RsmG [Candidatus Kapabacteria bacterium]|jgi:16S rRNA (guanine527-N7)-methyltransferase|nr:16S rRNA (guanine(527)-N(7))-methyltransferase RsmG [Candidatus Kapabacteria bacterium]HOM04116.1 16S rRNA (guanine(527)-N(7))-methyltransferase RsmG [Candidatus Kapabacteria bacterium]HOQ49351.1 16S rRNA (guanine(527)-N(7))-methyltransferase RsmG [Candidatus Kapabacteria bacterium]HPP38745.1 16S rRNA (guanine(527)-N(7))-methyltransferase RsmG [Candidatus Kapabacteria bacterium]HPU23916.1 16S rRNA (guanine(527)-N(7))-methyltransferase RsmG [Candidatus Kapabacteria bacterium]